MYIWLVGKLRIPLLGRSGPSGMGCLTSAPVSLIRMPDSTRFGPKMPGKSIHQAKKALIRRKPGKKALIRDRPDMAYRKFPTSMTLCLQLDFHKPSLRLLQIFETTDFVTIVKNMAPTSVTLLNPFTVRNGHKSAHNCPIFMLPLSSE